MKYIFISLFLFCLSAKAQQPEEIGKKELQDFIYGKHMVEQGRKSFRLPKRLPGDSIFTLTCDSVTFRFSILKLASVKTKDYKAAVKYRNGLTEIRHLYAEGLDTLDLESINSATEKLLADAILRGQVEQVLVTHHLQTNYVCESYGFSKRGRPALFALYDRQGRLFWSYTYVICFGIKFR